MKIISIALLVLLTLNISVVHAQEATTCGQDSISKILIKKMLSPKREGGYKYIKTEDLIEDLKEDLKKDLKNDNEEINDDVIKKAHDYFDTILKRVGSLQSDSTTLKNKNDTLNAVIDEYKNNQSISLLLNESNSIFTDPLPKAEDIHGALRNFRESITLVSNLAKGIVEMEKLLASYKDESVTTYRDMTYMDFVQTDRVQKEYQDLKKICILVSKIDDTMFSAEQKKYIDDIIDKYNKLVTETFL